jgi:endonuclease YncB( thermonuclease family)
MDLTTYPSGVDTRVFLGPQRLRDGESVRDLKELDAQSVSFIEEGSVLPLYDFNAHLAREVAYGTRLVSGALHLNFSQGHIETLRLASPFRADGFQALQGATLWVEQTKVDWATPGEDGSIGPAVVRETFRIEHVWEHPFQHQPDPSAAEVVTFTAHAVALVEREEARVDAQALLDAALSYDPDQTVYKPLANPFGPSVRQYAATVVHVTDGDTFTARLEGSGKEITVRLMAADTPETTKDTSDFKANRPVWWTWPEESGVEGGPSAAQLDGWGDYAKEVVKEWFAARGNHVFLIADPYSDPQDNTNDRDDAHEFYHGYLETDEDGRAFLRDAPAGEPRYIFQVTSRTGEDLEELLVREGLAVVLNKATRTLVVDGETVGRGEHLRRLYQAARAQAGKPGAKGVWSSFEPPPPPAD